MSRSALERAALRQAQRGEIPQNAHTHAFEMVEQLAEDREAKGGEMPIHGNDRTYNLNPLLAQNIVASEYFRRDLVQIQTYREVVDEIYNRCDHCAPWAAGTSRAPSTAFCLLMKLFVMRLTRRQMHSLLSHEDSPYIRALGFLYLRYTCEPKGLWKWFEPYIDDPEEFVPSPGDPPVTMGMFVQRLIKELQYFGTLLPRIPVLIERKMKVQLLLNEEKKRRAVENEALVDRLVAGVQIRAIYSDEENDPAWYEAVIDSVEHGDEGNCNPLHVKFWVSFPEYGNTELVSLGEVQLLESRDESRSRSHDPKRESRRRGRSWSRSRSRSRERRRRGDSRDDPRRLYEKVLESERKASAAVGRDYGSRPASYKGSLSLKQDRYTVRRKSQSPDQNRGHRYSHKAGRKNRSVSRSCSRSPPRATSKTVTAEGLRKAEMLKQRYGDASAKR
jgi:pre-mRNA-splicing factor 38B